EGDAIGEAFDDRVLALEQARQIEAQFADLDAVVLETRPGEVVQLAGFEQGLAGDAADVEAGAAEGGAFIDAGDLHAELGGADGGDVTAGTSTDNDEVETLR